MEIDNVGISGRAVRNEHRFVWIVKYGPFVAQRYVNFKQVLNPAQITPPDNICRNMMAAFPDAHADPFDRHFLRRQPEEQ